MANDAFAALAHPTRREIVEAAERVMRERGSARSTTKEIARAASYSEGTLYKHVESKEDLFLCVLTERLPSFLALVEELPARVGWGTVRETLEEVASVTALLEHPAHPERVSARLDGASQRSL